MTPLWIALILIPFGTFILIWVFVTAFKPPVEEEDEDDILDEAPEGHTDEVEEPVIIDLGEGGRPPAPSRPQITMNASGVGAGRKTGSGKAVAKVAKPEAAKAGPLEPARMTVESLKKITPPTKSDGPTVAANGMPIRPKR